MPHLAAAYQDILAIRWILAIYHHLLLLVRISQPCLFIIQYLIFQFVAEEPVNPCVPSPCGPYSQCREINGHAVCSCQANYIGTPPSCRPECTVSSECPQNRACINNKCQDPCPGTCGINARCNVVNHNPICSCPPNYVGEPFVRCILEESKTNLRFFLFLLYYLIYFF